METKETKDCFSRSLKKRNSKREISIICFLSGELRISTHLTYNTELIAYVRRFSNISPAEIGNRRASPPEQSNGKSSLTGCHQKKPPGWMGWQEGQWRGRWENLCFSKMNNFWREVDGVEDAKAKSVHFPFLTKTHISTYCNHTHTWKIWVGNN